MLKSLSIRDFVLLERVQLGFDAGLTVITGESGAGKSVLLEALELLAGARGETDVIRVGAERAEITAEIDLTDRERVRTWLAERELDEGDRLLLRRVLRRDGPTRAFINERPVPVASLRDVCSLWLEIHGQHEFQALLQRTQQLELLDRYAKADAERQRVAELARQWQAVQTELAELRRLDGAGEALVSLWSAQLADLEGLDLAPERVSALDAEQRRLAHGGSVQAALAQGVERLREGQSAVLRQLALIHVELSRAQSYEPRLGELLQRLESQRLELEALAADLEDLLGEIDLDPRHLERVEAELSRIHALARRHRVAPQELYAERAALRARLERAFGAEARMQSLLAEAERLRGEYRQAAEALGRRRRQAAAELAAKVNRLLPELGLKGAGIELRLEPRADDAPHPAGAEQAELLVATLPGQAPRPLRKVASGGELSRLALAIEVVTADVQEAAVLVFDEVDAGIGGSVADAVGRHLRALGRRRQVLCVTHLAQVAACGHAQVRVHKEVLAAGAVTRIDTIDGAARIDELARMLGGGALTDTSRAHAAELYTRAQRG